jgi:hypothetical protein
MQFDQQRRKDRVWAIERALAEDTARPILYHIRAGICWQPLREGYTMMVNGLQRLAYGRRLARQIGIFELVERPRINTLTQHCPRIN